MVASGADDPALVEDDEGRVVQEGTYRELSQQPGLFQQLLSFQVTSEPAREQPGAPA